MTVRLLTSLNTGLNSGLRQSISGGAEAKSFTGSTLDLDFAGAKSLKNQIGKEDIVSFTRASSGTYIGGDGLLKTTPVNLLTYSEQFDQWTAGTNTTVTPNYATAPDGTLTADRLQFADATGTFLSNTAATAGTEYTFSVYLKASTSSISAGTNQVLLKVGNVSQTVTATSEWQRVSATITASNTNPAEFDNSGAVDVLIWGAQLEENSTATDYIPTTGTISGAPRFEYDPATGESLGLLIEEARTNTILNSDKPTGSTLAGTFTRSLESVVSPRGIAENVRKIEVAGSGAALRFGPGASNGAVNTTYSVSFWIKSVDGGTGSVNIDINDRNITEVSYTGEWTRITRSGGNRSDVGHQFFDLSQRASTTDFYLFGVQMEEGSFSTSYIPTTSSTVTRAADIAEITGADFAKTNLLQYSERFDNDAWFKANSTTITPNTIAAPDGSITAETFNRNSTGTGNYLDSTSVSKNPAPITFTFSLFVKKNNAKYASLRLQGLYPSRADVVFDLDTGTVAVAANSTQNFSNARGSIQTSSSGWFRVAVTATSDSANSVKALISCSAEANQIDGTSSVANSVYIWGAQLEEGDVLTDYTPSVETFVSRASSATYVDDTTGLIKTTPVNLLLHSEDITQGQVATNTNKSGNTTTSPDGTNTADSLTETTASGSHGISPLNMSFTGGVAYTFSYYFKATGVGSARYPQLAFANASHGSAAWATFDLTNQVVGAQGGSVTTASVEDVGSGWYRCSVTATATGTVTTGGFISTSNISTGTRAQSYTGDGVSGIHLWGGQMEEGTTATAYIHTTSTISGAARYENGELILEEARTNLMLNSGTTAEMTVTNQTTRTSGGFTAPDGSTDASRVDLPAVTGPITQIVTESFAGIPLNTNHTSSVYLKGVNGGELVWLTFEQGIPTSFVAAYLTTEWQRFDITGSTSTGVIYFNVGVDTRSGTGQTNQPAQSFYIWGAQVEAGSYPTSYIPTTTTTVTRAADVSTSALGVDSFYNQSEGTVFIEVLTYPDPVAGKALTPFAFSDNSFNNRVVLAASTGTTQFNFDVVDSGSSVRAILGSYNTSGLKTAGGYKATGSAGSIDGASVVTSNTPNIPTTIARLDIGKAHNDGNIINGHIKRLAYFPTRLPDATLQSITS